ncbi:SIS domain protein [Peptostreptococcaceae bacterium AS15]|nr:SIS domain protein [Peptostreptococcaceae bacterium AS15]
MKKSNLVMDRYISKNNFLEDLSLLDNIKKAYEILNECYNKNGKLLICGNGGSAADCDHIVGELVKGFTKKRPLNEDLKKKISEFGELGIEMSDKLQESLPAINLSAHISLLTATLNDIGGEEVFAQQVLGYGDSNDVLIGISTSGNSANILKAGIVAKAKGMKTISFSGRDGGNMKDLFDISLIMPSNITSEIQDKHSVVYHLLCEMLEADRWEI